MNIKNDISLYIQNEVWPSFYERGALNLYKLASDFGIQLFEADFTDDTISGYISRNDENKFEIVVNRNHSLNRKRFTIAHELGHYISYVNGSHSANKLKIAGQIADYSPNSPLAFRNADISEEDRLMETEANEIAAEILMPRSDIDHYANLGFSLGMMANIFSVSESAMTIRLMKIYGDNFNYLFD